MPNNTDSSAHVTLTASELTLVTGGQAFPVGEAATAFGKGVEATYANRGNIANAFNAAHAYGHEKGWAGINAVRNSVSNTSGNPPGTTTGSSGFNPGSQTP